MSGNRSSFTAGGGGGSDSDTATNTRGNEVDKVPDRYETDQTSGGTDDPVQQQRGLLEGGQGGAAESAGGTGGGQDLFTVGDSGQTSEANQTDTVDATDSQESVETTTGQTVDPVPDRYEPEATGAQQPDTGTETSGGTSDTTDVGTENRASPNTQPLGMTDREFRAVARVANQNENISAQDLRIQGDRVVLTEAAREARVAESIERQLGTTRAERTAQRAQEAGATEAQAQAVQDAVGFSSRQGPTLDVNLDGDDVTTETRTSGPGGATSAAQGGAFTPLDTGLGEDTERVQTLSETGQQVLEQAQLERAAEIIDVQTPTRTTADDLTRTEQGGFTLDQQAQQEIERLNEGRQQAGEALGQYRSTEQVQQQEARQAAETQQGLAQYRAERQAAASRLALRTEAAQSYSEQLGFDVPRSAVNVERAQRDGETVFAPNLDTAEAKQAGRRQTDALSPLVGAADYLVEKWTPLGEVEDTGSVANVRRVEQFAGQNEVTGELEDTTVAGIDLGEAQSFTKGVSRGFTERVAQPIGDVAAFTARVGANPVDVTGRRGLILNTAAQEFAQGDTGEGFEALGGDTRFTDPTPVDRFSSGVGSGVAEVANPGAYGTLALTAADVGLTGADAVSEGDAGEFVTGAAGAGVALTERATKTAIENPAVTSGMVIGGAATGVGVGAAGKRAFLSARGRLATRGLDIQGEVPIENVERPDVRSGEAGGLTRLSTRAAPEGSLSIPPNRLPAQAADTPTQEIKNIAREFDDPRIRRALNTQADESVVFRAVSGRKPEVYEPRSRRPYDPDATFAAPSVARNFLDLFGQSDRLGGGIRRPRPIAGAKSLYQAYRGEGVPNIIAIAGEVEELPDSVSGRADITDFLQQQRNTGKFYAPNSRQQAVSGESEVYMSAEGAESTEAMYSKVAGRKLDPDEMPGTGVVESGETTRLVEVADPFQTRVRGERVPMQMFRQDTEDVIPLSQQGSFTGDVRRRIGFGDRGQVDLARLLSRDRDAPETRRTRTPDSDRDEPATPYRPGGREGTPLLPTYVGSPAGTEADATPTATDATETEPAGPDMTSPVGSGSPTGTGSDAATPSDPTPSVGDVPTVGEVSIPGTPTEPTPSVPDSPTTPSTPSTSRIPGIGTPTTPTEPTDTPTTTSPVDDTPITPTPFIPTDDPPRRRRRDDDDDRDEDESLFGPLFGGRRKESSVDFLNPLTGGRLETEEFGVPSELDEPAFLGFTDRDE